MKRLIYVILSLFILSQATVAESKTDAENLLKEKLDAVIGVLKQKELKADLKNEQIIEIVTPIFDFSLMAKLALGKKYWPGLDAQQQEKYTDVFVKRLKETYLEKMNLYTDEEVTYQTALEGKRKIQIPTVLISKGNKISMLYKLYLASGGWKIYDVEVEGVSIVSTFRSQFDQVLSTGTIDDLIFKLENPEKEAAKPEQTPQAASTKQTQ